MKASKLIVKLAELINDRGDMDVKIELLTENTSNIYVIGDVDTDINWVNDKWEYSSIVITHDIEDIQEFKNNLK